MAAQSELIQFTPTPTGNKTILLNGAFTPSTTIFWVGARASTNETDDRFSVGGSDFVNANDRAMASFVATNKGTRPANKAWSHYKDSGGATLITDGLQVSTAAGSITVNVTTSDISTPVTGIAIA